MNCKAHFRMSAAALAIGLYTASTSASAQTADAVAPAPGQEARNSEGVDDIVVTARRREESLQTAPLAVTALSGAALEARSLTNTADLVQVVPTLVNPTGGNGGGTGQFFLRGIGQNDQTVNLDPGVAIYIDGVYYARTQGANLELADMDRIEVLRGPQGTLYGKNATGGLINYITRSPDAPERTKVTLGASERNGLRGEFSFNRAISGDTVFLGGSFVALREDGYGTSKLTATQYNSFGNGTGNFGERSLVSGRLALMLKPSDKVSLTLRGDITHGAGTSQPGILYAIGAGRLTDRVLSPAQRADLGNFDDLYSGYNQDFSLRSRGVSLTADFDLGLAKLKSITAYRTLNQTSGFDLDATPVALADQRQILKQNQFSEELQLSGSAGGWLDWIAGLYYLNERPKQDRILDGRGSASSLTGGRIRFQYASQVGDSYGAFVNLDVHLAERLTLNAAVRYTSESKDIRRLEQLFADPNLVNPISTTINRQDKASWHQFTPKVGLNFQVNPDVLFYTTYSQGFRSGGFNVRVALAPGAGDSFDPETVHAVEVGAKTQLFDKRLRLNVALFNNWYKSIQLLARDTVIYTINGGSATIRGAELEADARLGERLRANLGVGYLETKLTKLDPRAITAGLRLGNELPYAPKWTVSAGMEYSVPVSDAADLRFRGDLSYRSSIYHSAADRPLDYQKGYVLVNGRIAYDAGGMELAVFGTNLFDKRYFLLQGDNTASPTLGGAYAVPAPPRRFGVQLSYKF